MYQYGLRFITFSLTKQLKTWLLAVTILGLVTMNIATLISDNFHTAAFAALGTALGYTVGSKLTDKMLSRSPTVNRNTDVASATRDLSRKNSELSRQNRTLKEQSAGLKKRINRKSAQIKQFSKKAAARSTLAATRNLSSLSGEAIPVLGIAVIAGVTAWNVHDSCQMLKDLNELNAEFELHQHLEEKREVCGIKVPTKEEILAEMQENWIIAYEGARDAVNHAADEIPEIPELSLSVKRYWAMLMETLEKFMSSIPDFFKDW
ncbi:hypothetical protein SAMN05216326_1695 [Nitrosomonas marina]|uniref:Uncharacterized protein n=1 Tax=Nitrosomonas marina TaxID=917 RepID=A0A1I0GEV7_9PROT|nr:hypothetical protein [Nitrosomonas marina]SET69622.1 hypothetical protein SAMN05216326_1695 [Nitrosomonas marina]